MKIRKTMLTILPVLALTGSMVAGCSVKSDEEIKKDAAPTGADATSGQPTQPGNAPIGAIADLAKNSCVANKEGVYGFTGEVKNNDKEKMTYTVRADVTNLQGHASIGNKSVNVDVEPGKAAPVKIDSIYRKNSKSPKNLGCVITVTKLKK